jgi:hypothetical protein
MSRQSPYQIVLSAAEFCELSALAQQYTLPYFQVVRAKMILLAVQGLPVANHGGRSGCVAFTLTRSDA